MNIGIDMMGGDYAPLEAVKGIARYFSENQREDVHLFLFGNADAITPHITSYNIEL